MILSGGEIILGDTTPTFANTYYAPAAGVQLTGFTATYPSLYRNQLWVYVVVRKLATATARLPLKVYRKTPDGREPLDGHPFAQLLDHPNDHTNPKLFWEWTVSTLNLWGEAMWIKIRDKGGRPRELWPIHPLNVSVHRNENGTLDYIYHLGTPASPKFIIPQADIVHHRCFNPDTTLRGMSPLEPLRATLLNEDSARRATQSFWKNGARPGVALSTPKVLSADAAARLRANFDALHGGTDNTGNTAVLEEGMLPHIIPLNMEEAQYIETRKLNQVEVCAAYDIPPPVVHILDRATFSNITEQMRSMYRDTMAPRLQLLEAELDFQLRPDFGGPDIYAEFLMDEVLRGDFEVRSNAYQAAINSGWLKPSEVRTLENMSPAKGADRLFVNATLIPIDEVSSRTSPNPPAIDLGVDQVVAEPQPAAAPLAKKSVRDLMSKLGRLVDLSEVDVKVLTEGLNGEASVVRDAYEAASDLADFHARIRAAEGTT